MRISRYLTWITLVVIIILVNLPTKAWDSVRALCREIIAPFHSVASGLGYRVSEGCAAVVDPAGKITSRRKMEEELASLRERIRRLEQLDRENAELRVHLGHKTNSVLNLESCEVITRGEASGWWECVVVNKGSRDGIAVGMAVVSDDGVVGRTSSISEHTSEVLLITDRNSSVPAKLLRSGAFGIVNGGGVSIAGNPVIDMGVPQNPCNMDNIPSGVAVQVGDKVVTSGLGTVFLEGLPIGTVVSVGPHKSGLYQVARIKPAADLVRLRYVFVVKQMPLAAGVAPKTGTAGQGTGGN